MQIPAFMSFETTIHHDDDRRIHHVFFRVPGAKESEVWGEIRTQYYDDPAVEAVYSNGLRLNPWIAERLLLAACDLLLIHKIATEAAAVTITLSDGRKFINDSLDRHDARIVRCSMRPFIRPDLHVRTFVSITP